MPHVDFEQIGDNDAEVESARRLLPSWFVPRMMTDVWSFGLQLSTGIVLAIEQITAVTQAADGSLWLDVQMVEDPTGLPQGSHQGLRIVGAPNSRKSASVAVAHVVWAFELAYT